MTLVQFWSLARDSGILALESRRRSKKQWTHSGFRASRVRKVEASELHRPFRPCDLLWSEAACLSGTL